MRKKFKTNKFLILVFLLSSAFSVITNVVANDVVAANGAVVTSGAVVNNGVRAFGFCDNSGVYSTYDWGCNCYDDNCGIYVQGLNCNLYFRTCWGSGCANTYAWTTGCF